MEPVLREISPIKIDLSTNSIASGRIREFDDAELFDYFQSHVTGYSTSVYRAQVKGIS
jgi:hypothetical protein